jgi:hypothetical protein
LKEFDISVEYDFILISLLTKMVLASRAAGIGDSENSISQKSAYRSIFAE